MAQVLAIREPVHGADSFPVAKTRFNTGVVTLKAGHHRRAIELVDGAIAVFRQHTGEQSFEMVGALRTRGQCREGLGDDDGALADYRRALAIAERFDAPAAAGRLDLLATMTAFHCRRGDVAAARGTAGLALAALEAGNPIHDRRRESFEHQLASCARRGPGAT